MAGRTSTRRTNAKQAEDNAAAEQDTATSTGPAFLTTLAPSNGVARNAGREEKPIHTLDVMRQSLNDGKAYAFTVNEDDIKTVVNDLTRAAKKLDCSLRKSMEDLGDGTVRIDFMASAEKIQRKYTVEDIKAWVVEQYGVTLGEKETLPSSFRTAYRVAHGHEKMDEDKQAALSYELDTIVQQRS